MNEFYDSAVYKIIKHMQSTGNKEGVIAQWKSIVKEWAYINAHNNRDAAALCAWLPMWQVRPFYTATELAPIFPALALALGYIQKMPEVPDGPALLENRLKFGRLPCICMRHPMTGIVEKFFIVERLHHWVQAEPEEIAREFQNALNG
jgi:hypothetical protein